MHRLIDCAMKDTRSQARYFCLVMLVVLFSLFASIFSDVGVMVHAASGSPLKNIQRSSNHYLDSHHASVIKISHGHSDKINKPALMLTRANAPDVISHGKHIINYVLSVSNGRSAGSILAGNTIIISNIIPSGVTNIKVHAKSADWKVKLDPSLLTATYVGSYPIRPGARISPLFIHGILQKHKMLHRFLPAVVRLIHLGDLKKSGARVLQQQAVHDFTVQSVASRAVKPLVNPTYQVGQTVAYTLSVSNDSAAGALLTGDAVTVTDTIPAGLTGLIASASSSDWTVTLGATTSPTTLTATYIGAYPVLPGATLAPIVVVGTLTTTAIPQIVNTAVVVTPNDLNAANNSGTNTITVVPLPDLTVTDPVPSGTTFQVGKPVTYTLTGSSLSSAGPVLAGDAITITDTIPAGLTGITATDSSGNWSLSLSATSGPATLTATYIGTYPVAAGTTLPAITITGTLASAAVPNLANSVTISTPNDSNAANNTASNTITVVIQPDLTLTKTAPAGTYQVGLPVTYTLTASNVSGAGPVLAGDAITISDTIPTGLTSLTASGTNWTVTLGATTSPTTLTATYTGAFPVAGGTTLPTIALTGTLTATSPPQVINTATVTTPNDSNNANNSGSKTVAVLAAPDLTVTDPVPTGTTFEVGKPVTYTLTGSNVSGVGPVLAGDAITIIDTIPAGLTGITATSSGGWTLSLSATSGPATLTATYTGTYPVAAGTTLSAITITGTLAAAAVPNLTNSATISTPKDTNAANNTASNTITVVVQPDLTLTKTAPAGTYQVGLPVTYTLTASNASGVGPVLAGDVITISDSIPTGLTSLTASGTNWTVTLSTTTSPSTLTATYTGAYPVAAGSSLPPITITGTLTTTAPPQVVNTATVTTPNDGNNANNSGSKTVPVFTTPDLMVTDPVPSGTTFQVGKPVTYTLTGSSLSTAGPVLAGDAITITDTIPAGLTGITATDSSGNWSLSLSATSGPATLTATYIGTYPVAAGTTLPAITITGTLAAAAVPNLTNSAAISTPKDANAANNTASNTITVVVQPDLTLTKTAPAGTYQVGLPVTYTLTASNASGVGPVLAGDAITISDSIPTGLTSLTASGTNWTVTLSTTTSPSTLTATYTGTYPVAAATSLPTIAITGTLTSTSPPQVVNTATVTTPNDSNNANNSGSKTVAVLAAPDLTVTDPTPTGTTFEVGKSVTYTVTGSNLSTAGPVLTGDAITITDTIPAGLTGITATSSGGWTLSLSATSGPAILTATYTGTYPVAAGATLPAITITGTLVSAAVPSLANSATISTPKDTNAANNTASNTITVVVQPDLTLTKTAPAGSYQVGLPVTYTLTASNASGVGPVLAGDAITISDSIPTGLTSLTASGTNWTVTLSTTTSPSTLTATYTGAYPVAAGSSLPPITITGTLTTTAPPQVVNTATVTTPNDGNNANNSGSKTVPVFTTPDLTVTDPVPSGTTFQVGKPVTYTLTGSSLSTAGPVLAGDAITIIDTIPAGLTGITATSSGGWTLSLSATSGPATLTATYTGTYPVAAGTTLSAITITGTLAAAAVPNLTNSATISTPKDANAANNTASNTITVVVQPDLTLTKTAPAGTTFEVGKSVTYTLTVSNVSGAGPTLVGDAITISDAIPTGLTGLTTSGTNWTVTLGTTTSPTTLTAIYTGAYPVAAGTSLSPITLSGTLTTTARPQLVNTATVTTPNDGNSANNSATKTITVLPQPDLSLTKTVALSPTSLVREQAQEHRLRSVLKSMPAHRS